MLNKTIEIAKEAGKHIRDAFGSQISVEFKTDEANIVTNVDKAAEEIIKGFISKEYPDHAIIAEESGSSNKGSDYTWIIDPIDGTTNFAHNLPIFAVSIGIQKKDELVIGVIYDVMSDVIYSAEKGSGAYANDNRISVSKNNNLKKSLLVTGFSYDRQDEYRQAIKIFGSFLTKSRAVRRLGSAALDFCYVASGVFDGFWEANLSPWDVAAGIILVKEAGGRVTDFKNDNITPFSSQFLATNGIVHDAMIGIMEDI
jgi:myo-inositol-1(or 4)-monophosphatase